MPHSTTVASRCQSGFGLLAASHRSFVRSCRGGSRSFSAISPSPAGRGGYAVEPSRRCRSNARLHRADTCALIASVAHAAPSIGTLPPHRWPDSSLSARSTPFHCNFAGYISVPFVPTAANCRDRQRQRCAQRCQRPRCSAYRPRPAIWPRDFVRPRNQHYGARLRLSPKTKQ